MQSVKAQTEQPHESGVFIKRIGSTTYRVGVHFSRTSRETMNDKIMRLVKSEARDERAAGK